MGRSKENLSPRQKTHSHIWAVRERYILTRMSDLPKSYQYSIPFSGDRFVLMKAEAEIRKEFAAYQARESPQPSHQK